MSIQHSIDTMKAWTHALRVIMGYPEFDPIGSPIAYASGGRKNATEALQIAAIVEQTGRDVVYVQFDLPVADGPTGISLATRATYHVDWHCGVRLYAADDDTPVELLTDTHRWSVGPRSILTALALPRGSRVGRGIERANHRWREAAERMYGIRLPGSVHIPAGGTYADAVPLEALRSAA